MEIMARRPLLISLVWISNCASSSSGKRPSGSKPIWPGLYSSLICSVAGALRLFQPAEMRTDSQMPMTRMTNSQNCGGASVRRSVGRKVASLSAAGFS